MPPDLRGEVREERRFVFHTHNTAKREPGRGRMFEAGTDVSQFDLWLSECAPRGPVVTRVHRNRQRKRLKFKAL
jgi:hypothetical protein